LKKSTWAALFLVVLGALLIIYGLVFPPFQVLSQVVWPRYQFLLGQATWAVIRSASLGDTFEVSFLSNRSVLFVVIEGAKNWETFLSSREQNLSAVLYQYTGTSMENFRFHVFKEGEYHFAWQSLGEPTRITYTIARSSPLGRYSFYFGLGLVPLGAIIPLAYRGIIWIALAIPPRKRPMVSHGLMIVFLIVAPFFIAANTREQLYHGVLLVVYPLAFTGEAAYLADTMAKKLKKMKTKGIE